MSLFREEGESVSFGRKGNGVPFLGGGGMVIVLDTAAFGKFVSKHNMLLFIAVESFLLYKSLVPKDCFMSSMMITDGKRASYIQQKLVNQTSKPLKIYLIQKLFI